MELLKSFHQAFFFFSFWQSRRPNSERAPHFSSGPLFNISPPLTRRFPVGSGVTESTSALRRQQQLIGGFSRELWLPPKPLRVFTDWEYLLLKGRGTRARVGNTDETRGGGKLERAKKMKSAGRRGKRKPRRGGNRQFRRRDRKILRC